ncbi:MAG: DUF5615 family PIN-like protein [Phycisphaerae bacterium]|nr:DUF5615 family PIN-like protein [Phycisphaerae bacterium]
MKILVDMNLTPDWCRVFEQHGWEAVHWSGVGDPKAPDHAIMAWAVANGFVVFTHDLDFGSILAGSQAEGPSVIQVRARDVLPDHLGSLVVAAIRQFESLLRSGALIVVDEGQSRARILPLQRAEES